MSTVIPVCGTSAAFARCLESVAALAPPPHEVIVVRDGPCNRRGEGVPPALPAGAVVVDLPRRSGPAAARNAGAGRATGDVLLFLDADVEAPPDTIARVAAALTDPSIAAIIGTYDRWPAAPGLVSQFRNLAHRYVHQRAREEGFTFWGACGAVRRSVFLAVGGFDETYREPSVEDIELGYRLRAAGWRIRVVKDLEVRHLKRWTLSSMIHCDVVLRGLPWAELVLRERRLDNDLNLQTATRVAVALLALAATAAIASPFLPGAGVVAIAAGALLVAVDWPLWRFFARERGVLFALCAVPLQWLHYACGGGAFAAAAMRWALLPRRRARAWTGT